MSSAKATTQLSRTEAAQQSTARSESPVLSERDRAAFFQVLVHAPKPNARLRRAFRSSRERIAP